MQHRGQLDVIRAFACLCIVILHAVPDLPKSLTWISLAENSLQIVVRMGLPLFFMLSGYLLLHEYPANQIKTFYQKRLWRIIPLFLAYSYAYFIIETGSWNLLTFCQAVIHKETGYHLWYIYCILGIYLCTPFLGNLLVKVSPKHLFLLLMLSAGMQTINTIVPLNSNLLLPFPHMWVIYFLVGFCLRQKENALSARAYRKIWICSTITLLVLEALLWECGVRIKPFDNGLLILLQCASFFAWALTWKREFPNITSTLSKYSYEVYLIHPMFIMLAAKMSQYTCVRTCLVLMLVWFFVEVRKSCSLMCRR